MDALGVFENASLKGASYVTCLLLMAESYMTTLTESRRLGVQHNVSDSMVPRGYRVHAGDGRFETAEV